MKIRVIVLGALLAIAAVPLSVQAAEYAQTVRLGNCVIRPGTTVLKLVECAGQPVSKDTSGVDPRTGALDNVWMYRANNRTVLIHVASEVVTRVEVKAE